jgi:bifunctional DNA-binding transcriptional regulator/antitoxin component of YhaV-PrlF toxin-antitoxin module
MMSESTINAKGQTTVPADIRQAIADAPGTRLVWHVLPDSRLFVRVKNKTAADVKGILSCVVKPASWYSKRNVAL